MFKVAPRGEDVSPFILARISVCVELEDQKVMFCLCGPPADTLSHNWFANTIEQKR